MYRTIKVPLKKILRDPDKDTPTILNAVSNINISMINAYHFIRLFVLDKYHKNEELPKLNKNFCNIVLSIVSKINSGGRPTVNPFINELKHFYENIYAKISNNILKSDISGYARIFQDLGVEMETAYKNNISIHFMKRLKKFIRIKISEQLKEKEQKETDTVIKNKETKDEINKKKKLQRQLITKISNSIMEGLYVKNKDLVDKNYIDLYDYCLINFIPKEDYKKGKKKTEQNMKEENCSELYDEIEDDEGTLGYDLKANTDRYVFYTLKLADEYEKNNIKTFQPLCLRKSYIPKNIPITYGVYKLLFGLEKTSELTKKNNKKKKDRIKNNLEKEKLSKERDDIDIGLELLDWNKIFNIYSKYFKVKGYSFYNRIETDGVGCSILFIKSKYRKLRFPPKCKINMGNMKYITELTDEELEVLKNKTLVGLDPGKYNLIHMSGKPNGIKDKGIKQIGDKLKYTHKQKIVENYSKKNNKIKRSIKKDENIIEIEKELNDCNSKTIDIDKFKEYIKCKVDIGVQVIEHYNKIVYRKLNLRNFIHTKKTTDILLKNIEKTFGNRNNIVIGYGNWSRKTHMKFLPPTPGVGLRNIIAKRFKNTYLIDEFRTSCRCYYCTKELTTKVINGKKYERCLVCHDCLSLENESENHTRYINRDINGSLNILKVLEEWISNKSRPEGLKRDNSKELSQVCT